MEEIARGAEAVIYRDREKIFKERISKVYRNPVLDQKIRESRTKIEANILGKVGRVCNVPGNIMIDGTKISMDFIDRPKLSEALSEEECQKLGEEIAKMHERGVAHGDLTTSNVLQGPVIIDFGMSKFTKRVEDFAMDVHLFKSCLLSRHPGVAEKCYGAFWRGYQKFQKSGDVKERIDGIEKRGRYNARQP